MTPVTVRVPGSTSNCGAGFDVLGMALSLHNEVTLSPVDSNEARPERESDGRAAGMVAEVQAEFARATGRSGPGFQYRIEGEVPPSRGLGSSVTVLAGVLAGLNHWHGSPLDSHAMAEILTRIEGHPDNATAGVWGGFCVSRCGESAADLRDLVRVEIPSTLKFVVASPELEVATKNSRGILPDQISHLHAVRSINSVAFLTAAFVSGDFTKLKNAVTDFLHEPYRLPGIAGGAEAIRAGVEAGGLTGWLSGSGSSVLCVAESNAAEAVGDAMRDGFTAAGQSSRVQLLAADNQGLQVVSGRS